MEIMNLFVKEDDEYKEVHLKDDEIVSFFLSASDDEGHMTKDVKMITLTDTKVEDDGIIFTMSDESLNRFEFKVKTAGIGLKNYKKNPVLLWSHDTSIPAIGKMENVRINDNKLIGKATFAPKEIDEFAWSIEQKVKMGIISAGSIGFRVKEVDIPKKPRADGTTMTVTVGELEEFSLCNVPANPNALIKNSLSKDSDVELQDTVKVPTVKIDYIDLLFSNRSRKTSDLENLLEQEGQNINKIFGDTK